MNKHILTLLAVLALALVAGQAAPARAAAAQALTVTPSTIEMGAAYDGVGLKVEGLVPEGSQVVLRLTGAPGELHMREKGKVFGLLWMNLGALTFHNVPRVMLVETSEPFEQLGEAARPFSLESLRRMVEVEEAAAGEPGMDPVAELLRLKKREGLCSETVGGMEFGQAESGMRPFSAVLQVPSALAPGQYKVEAVALRGGEIVQRAEMPVQAVLVGLPAWLHDMAFNHGTLYGILATVVAILAGLVIGLIFKDKGGAH